MRADIKTAWLEKLRSGTIEQIRGQLCREDGRCCALGVLVKVMAGQGMVKFAEPHSGQLPVLDRDGTVCFNFPTTTMLSSVGLDAEVARTVADRNDDGDGSSFAEIATYIEKNA